jgi:serine/threonine-protein kinase
MEPARPERDDHATLFLQEDSALRSGATPLPRGLPPDILEEAAQRLSYLSIATVVVSSVMFILLNFVIGRSEPQAFDLTAHLLLQAISLTIFALSRWGHVQPLRLLDLGVAYQVVLAFVGGLLINRRAWPEDAMIPSWSPIAVMVLLFPVFIPNTTRRMLLAAFVTAAMDPLTLFLWIHKGNVQPPLDSMILRFAPTAMAVLLVAFYAKLLRRLGDKVTKARRMGSYRLVERLGRGGMGEVWRAEHRFLARPAAVKLIRPEMLGAIGRSAIDAARRRFEREAQATAALQSPHTIVLYDFGTSRNGDFYYVMELLDGLNLDALVERFGPQPAARTAFILQQACESLHEAHTRGLVHRDVKPANLFLCRYAAQCDFVKVLDFGLVKVHRAGDGKLTQEGVATGTPAFMPPELARGVPDADARADLYALGCVGYWLLTGELLFEAETPMGMAIAHATNEPVPPSRRSEIEVPDALESLILSCLNKDPAGRPASALDLARTLEATQLVEAWSGERARQWWEHHLPEHSHEGREPAVAVESRPL